jgi:hypothetical protein
MTDHNDSKAAEGDLQARMLGRIVAQLDDGPGVGGPEVLAIAGPRLRAALPSLLGRQPTPREVQVAADTWVVCCRALARKWHRS